MNKWIGIIGAGIVAAGVALVVLKPSETNTSSSKKVSDAEFLAYVPADTVYFVGGVSSSESAEFMQDYPVLGASPSQLVLWKQILDDFANDGVKGAKFLSVLIDGIVNNTEGTLSQVSEYFGASSSGPYALYSHGIIPVVRMPVANSEIYFSRLAEATEASGVQTEEKSVAGHTVRLWHLTESKGDTIKLAVIEQNNMLAMTLITSKDDESMIKARLGLEKPAQSIVSSGELAQLKKDYGYTDDMLYFIHFERLAAGFLDPTNNEFGQNLLQYLSDEDASELQNKLTPECKKDYQSFIAKVPRLLGGYRDISIKGDTLAMDFQSLLELKNPNVITHLRGLRGHIPAHATQATDKLMAFGLGLDVDNAVPSMTALWNEFISAEYTCDHLVKAQDSARQTNPAMAGMFLGMVQGLKGVGISVFGFDMDIKAMSPKGGDFIVSAAAENPQTLAAMAAMVPMLQGVSIPADGSEVLVPLPMLPPEMELKASIKGKQLAVFMGPKASEVVASLEKEGLEGNGLFSIAANYNQFGKVIEELAQLEDLAQQIQEEDFEEGACVQLDSMRDTFANLNMDFSMVTDVSDKGGVIEGVAHMGKYVWTSPKMTGTYTVEKMDSACAWVAAGTDERRKDGTGTFKLSSQGCDTEVTEYSWEKSGSRLSMQKTASKTRETCDAEWQEQALETQSCYLYASTGDQYKCFFDVNFTDNYILQYKSN